MISKQSESIKDYEKAVEVTQWGQAVSFKHIIKKANVQMWPGIFF